MKSSTKSPKTTKSAKPVRHNKDGYGAHWHSVGWIAVIAIVLSASTMILAASAQTPSVSPSLQSLSAQLDVLEQKIDLLNKSAGN